MNSDDSEVEYSGPDRAERERIWRYARFAYLAVFLFLIAGMIFSIIAIIRLLHIALS